MLLSICSDQSVRTVISELEKTSTVSNSNKIIYDQIYFELIFDVLVVAHVHPCEIRQQCI